jgi:hypothetical protein
MISRRVVTAAKNKVIALSFSKKVQQKEIRVLWNDLKNNFTRGKDEYPSVLTGAYNLLLNFKAPL